MLKQNQQVTSIILVSIIISKIRDITLKQRKKWELNIKREKRFINLHCMVQNYKLTDLPMS